MKWITIAFCPQITLTEGTAQILLYFTKLRFQRRWVFPYNSSPGPRGGQTIVLSVVCPAADVEHRTCADRSQRNKGHDTQVTPFTPGLLVLEHVAGITQKRPIYNEQLLSRQLCTVHRHRELQSLTAFILLIKDSGRMLAQIHTTQL